MATHGDREPTWKQKLEITRKMFICNMIYDMMNKFPFDYNEDILIIHPINYKEDIRHAISTCKLSALKIQSERG